MKGEGWGEGEVGDVDGVRERYEGGVKEGGRRMRMDSRQNNDARKLSGGAGQRRQRKRGCCRWQWVCIGGNTISLNVMSYCGSERGGERLRVWRNTFSETA